MDFIKKIKQQRLANARKPSGWLGGFLTRAMNIRHSPMTDWGLSRLSIDKNDVILDVGCGGGAAVQRLAGIAAAGKVFGVDISEESVLVSRSVNRRLIHAGRVEIRQGAVDCLPFPAAMFDLVTAINTHNYWPDLAAGLREILRVVKPGGQLAIIGSVYLGAKNDRKFRSYPEWIEIKLPGIHELQECFQDSGYSEVQAFEEPGRGWMCIAGKKPV